MSQQGSDEEAKRKRDKVGDFLKKNLTKGELALKHAIGLGQTPNVVPVTQPIFNGPPRPVEVGWHPVGGLAGKWFAEETGLGKMITERTKSYPDPTQHWAILVGEYAHQLWMDENFDVIYTNEQFKREEWRTFPVGETRLNDDAVRRMGETVIQSIRERQPAYNLITNNCQTYALQLLDAIKVDGHKDFGTTLAVYNKLTGSGKVMDLFPDQQQVPAIEGPPSQQALPAPSTTPSGTPSPGPVQYPHAIPPPGTAPYGPPGAAPYPYGTPAPGMPYGPPGSPPPDAMPYGHGTPPPGTAPYPYGPPPHQMPYVHGTPPPGMPYGPPGGPPPGMPPYGYGAPPPGAPYGPPGSPPPGMGPCVPTSPPPGMPPYTPGPGHPGTVSYAQQVMQNNTTQLDAQEQMRKHDGERGVDGPKKHKKGFFSLSRFTKS